MNTYSVSTEDEMHFRSKRVAILGYGSQGRAQALNLRDSGADVIVGTRAGNSFEKAKADGFSVMSVCDAVKSADVLALLFPDESTADIYAEDIAPYLREGHTLLFAHGFNILYNFITPPKFVDVVLVAPKGVGPMVRRLYEEGCGVASLVSIHQDASGFALKTALGFASAIGSSRSAIIESTFKDETETDLFGEQAIICGGIPALIEAAVDTLIEAGYPPELAYSECAHEVKLVIDLIYAKGFGEMYNSVSKTASYGGITRGNRLISDRLKADMKEILREVQSGEFAAEWIAEKRAGSGYFHALVEDARESDMEKAGIAFREILEKKSE